MRPNTGALGERGLCAACDSNPANGLDDWRDGQRRCEGCFRLQLENGSKVDLSECLKSEEDFPEFSDICYDCHSFEETQREIEADWLREGY